MAKDPATLWYWNDWSGGTSTFTRHLKGCYMDLLSAQFNNGPLSLDEIKTILGPDFGPSWPTLQKKFVKGDNGLFFNERLQIEKEKRMAFTASRRANAKAYAKHKPQLVENENEDEIKDELKGGVGEKLQQAFDEAYMEKMKLSKAYPGINLDAELATFKVKVISSVEDYQQHDVNGLRKAFNYQLRNAKPKENGITKALKQSAGLKELIRAKYGTEGAKPGTAIG